MRRFSPHGYLDRTSDISSVALTDGRKKKSEKTDDGGGEQTIVDGGGSPARPLFIISLEL